MKLFETSVTDTTVWMRFADDDDLAKAKEWIDIQVPISALKALPKKLGMFAQADVDWGLAEAPSPGPLTELNRQRAGVIKIGALDYVKGFIEGEIRTLKSQL